MLTKKEPYILTLYESETGDYPDTLCAYIDKWMFDVITEHEAILVKDDRVFRSARCYFYIDRRYDSNEVLEDIKDKLDMYLHVNAATEDEND